MQPTYSDTYGWTVACGCEPQHAGSYYTVNRCDDCGGRGFHELTDDEAGELLAPCAPLDPMTVAEAKAAAKARYPHLAAFL